MFPARKKTSAAESDGASITARAPRMFSTRFRRLDVAPADAVMVGDSVEDDVKGALACGCPAILLERAGRSQGLTIPRIESPADLPAALGLLPSEASVRKGRLPAALRHGVRSS
jgi:FMN phosphatase YigB (HAD superfamily)